MASRFFSRALSSANTLHEAAELGDIDKLQQFVDAGKEMGYPARETLRARDALVGATCLHYAAEHGRTACAKWLLDQDVEIYAADHYGVTPLHLACLKGHLDVVSLLLNQGCGTETRDNEGDTGMHWAATKGHSEVMQMLRQFGAQVDVSNKAGWNPLHRAAYCGFADTCEWLMNNAVSIHAVNKEGNTALHLACQSNQLKVIEVLLQWGARANMTNASGFAPVDMTGIDAVQAVMEEFAPDTPKRRTLQERRAMLAKGTRWSFLRRDIAPPSVPSDSNKLARPAPKRRTSDGFPMGLTDSPMRIDHPTIYEDDEEDTSIFNLGIGLDAAGTDAMFNFGSKTAGSGGSTFTTHQQQQAEQEAGKRLSVMQVNDLSAAVQTSPTDMKIRVPRRSTRDAPVSSRESTSTRNSNKSDMTPWSDDDVSKRAYRRNKATGSFNRR
ncbi:hypothetical protein ABBQ32_011186 [Trebouxia sp. C0010 RCD-2024]